MGVKALLTLGEKDLSLNVDIALRKYGCNRNADIGGKRLAFKC